MKIILQKILKILAKLILFRYKPEVIGITGSMGKSSAKEAIYEVLAGKFNVRKSIRNYNNEFGVPLTIIGAESPLSSVIGWIAVIILAIKLILIKQKDYPKILILEMAADKPSDIDYLTDMAKCQIGVLTAISQSHMENFGSLEDVRKEKALMISKLKPSDWSVINSDDENIKISLKDVKAKKFSYGINTSANLTAQEIRIIYPVNQNIEKEFGLNFKLVDAKAFAPIFLPGSISQGNVYAALAGAAVGIIKGMNLVEISQALRNFSGQPGRLKVIKGIKQTLLLDDTYNASPASVQLALETLAALPGQTNCHKYAVLGDMMELGSESELAHHQVGKLVAKKEINKLIAHGERSRDIIRGAKEAGMPEDDIFYFSKLDEVGEFLENRIKPGDIILIKGSQEMRLEKIVKRLMADPARANELLVRQGNEW